METNIVSAFEKQVDLTPNNIAVIFNDKRLTYEELNKEANKIAYSLIHRFSVKRGDIVPLVLERNEKMIVAMLAVLKAGGCYTALSKQYPKARIDFVKQQTKAKIMIDDEFLNQEFGNEESNPNQKISENDLAYIVYTSGTTGTPKGVLHTEKSVINHINSYWEFLDFDRTTHYNMLFLVNYVFSVATTQIYESLLHGQTLIISKPDCLEDIVEFTRYLNQEKINYVQCTPSLADSLDYNRLSNLKTVAVAGEQIPESLFNKTNENNITLINVYGQSEFHAGTAKKITALSDINKIGHALSGMTAFVLDETLREVKSGSIGEICFTGEQLSSGYLNQEQETQNHFIENPFGEGKLCKTGDIVKKLSNDEYEFIGRKDFQLNINGIRTEPGEIETQIKRMVPEVDAAVVTGYKNQFIVAYYVSQKQLTESYLKSKMITNLPEYMQPSMYIWLKQLPLNDNGKLDRSKLPEVEIKKATYVAPETSSEKELISATEQVLHTNGISVLDDFFKLGGNSLNVTQLINLIRSRTNRKLSARDVFNHPEIKSLASLLDEKDILVDDTFSRAPQQNFYPMSPAQRRMFILYELDHQSTAYNEQTVLNFSGRINEQKLQVALNEMIQRHESLRTQFLNHNGNYVQKIMPDGMLDFKVISNPNNYSDLVQPLNPSQGQTMRVRLVRGLNNDALFIDKHHIITDGTSEEIFYKELGQLYNGEKLAKPIYHYKDYSNWFSNLNRMNEKYWWSQYLDGYQRLELQTDHKNIINHQPIGRTIRMPFDPKLLKQINLFAQENQLSEYMVFFSAVSLLLAKMYHSSDYILGTVSNGRVHERTMNMLGMFINTLPIRVQPDTKLKLIDFLKQVKDNLLAAQSNQNYQFEEIVSDLHATNENGNPLFDCMFVYQDFSANTSLFAGKGHKNPYQTQAAKFPLTFEIQNTPTGKALLLNYDSVLFDEHTIKQLGKRLSYVLSEISKDTNKLVADVTIISDAERAKLLDFPKSERVEDVITLFEKQVNLRPNDTALKYKEKSFTYSELNQEVNKVANYLINEKHVVADQKIPLLLQRTEKMPIAILAVLKAGAAYVPISLKYPQERIDFIIEACKAEFVIDDQFMNQQFPDQMDNPQINVDPNQLAYLIFTSGTSGTPKGVMVKRKNLSNFVVEVAKMKNSGMHPGIVNGAFFEYVFDSSIHDLIRPFTLGESVVILDTDLIYDIDLFIQTLKDYQVNAIGMTPSLAARVNLKQVPSLQVIHCGGEAITQEVIDKYVNSNIQLNNCYGPTEATVLSFVNNNASDFSIGKPIGGVHPYVLDDNLQLLPEGAVGNLYIGGNQVTRGYLDRPEETAKHYVKNPFGEDIIYDTGDLVRLLNNKTYQYLGRKDFQVKIRGFRVELGEIENKLKLIDGISQAAVIVKNDNLVAYYVAQNEFTTDILYDELQKSLPRYMIPTFYVKLSELPLTINGKLNTRALPEPVYEEDYIAPRNAKEKKIEQAFCKVLRMEKVSVKTNFFRLGGNSIAAITLANLIGVPVKDIFEKKTISKLAQTHDKIQHIEKQTFQNIEEQSLSYAQQRLFFINELEEGTDAYNVPILLTLHSDVNINRFEQVLKKIVDRHEVLRTIYTDSYQKVLTKSLDITHKKIDIEGFFAMPFNLRKELPIRVNINHKVVAISIHHIAFDGWSTNIFLKEISDLYNNVTLEAPSLQYKDFAKWQVENQNETYLEPQKKYWLNNLSGYETLNFPTDYPRPKQFDYAGKEFNYALDENIMPEMKKIAQKYNTSLYCVALSAFTILLSAYSNQKDIVLGTPIANRHIKGTEDMIGCFVNTLALRSIVNVKESFVNFLQENSKRLMDVQAHQDLPFEKLVDALGEKKDLSRNPIFQIMFSFEDIAEEFESNNLYSSLNKGLSINSTKFDIAVTHHKNIVNFTFATNLFKQQTIEGIAQTYEKILKQIINQPQIAIADIEYNSVFPAMVHKNYPDGSLHGLFEQVTLLQPEHPAVIFRDTELTYAQLNQAANKVAHTLLDDYKVAPGTMIPILMKRNVDYIIAILGILKAGACYVPMSVDYPQERINYIKEKVNAPLIITDNFKITSKKVENPNVQLPSNALAYIIFTSGTTGKPKGVMIEHQAVRNTIFNQIDLLNITDKSRGLNFADFVFDASVFELFSALLAGATTYLLDDQTRKDYQLLKQTIIRNNVDYALLPPAILSENDLLPLKTLVVGGESTPQNIYQAYAASGTKMINAYGPTEISIIATEKPYEQGMHASNIGKALNNVVTYVLDEDGRQVPDNGIGELCVGGAGLARGYLHDEEKTRKAFVNTKRYGRLYRTGDLVKSLPNGDALYIGRNDFQVKLRGFRIELGEIETRLMEQKSIVQCLAVVKNSNIVAYYKGELKHSLEGELPPYMLPSSYVQLDEFPITINGKIDLHKLPEPTIQHDNFVEPQTNREKEIAKVFCELLHLDSVSIVDDFYSLGGNSILALKLANKINVQVKQIFEAKNIQNLAKLRPRTVKVTKETFANTADQILSFAQERLWFVEQFEQGSTVYNVPLVLNLVPGVSVDRVEHALEKIVQRHEILRTQIKGNYQAVSPNGLTVTHEAIDIDDYVNQVFDLENGLPIRANIYDHELTIVVHHIAFDGWSTEILLHELVDLYHGKELAPLPVQYKDYARWQRDYVSHDLFSNEMNYWIKNLSSYEKLNLPTDYERPKHFTYRGAEISMVLSKDLKNSLENYAQENQTSVYTVMLSALDIVLAKFSSQNDIVVGTPFANRHVEGIESLIGFFINTLPIRTSLNSKQDFNNLVKQNHRTIVDAQNNQDIPFEKVVSELGVDQDSSRNPVFQVLFSVQDFSNEVSTSNDVFTNINDGLDDHSAKYDLNILFEDNKLSINYCVDIFKESTINSIMETYLAVLQDVLQDDKKSIEDVAIAKNYAKGETENYPNKTVVDLFYDQLARTPNNTAVEYLDTKLTYSEFDRLTNQFANYLFENGVKPGDKIPLILERSEKMSIAIWGILKAGCAYVPISPEFPKERKQFILEQIKAKIIIDDSYKLDPQLSTQALSVRPTMNDLAYIIFTSGTTGKPKGVMIEHAGLSNRIQWMNATYPINETDKVYQKTNYVFDVSVWEQVWALLVGASIVFAKEGGHKDPIYLAKEIKQKQITVMHFVPSMLDAFLDTLAMYQNDRTSAELDVSGLKYVFCSGEALNINSVRKFKQLLPHVQLYNLYGPTEASIDVTYFDCNDPALKKVLIGRPVANTQCYVLSASNQLLPTGAIGELALGGVQLARGYINQPELTDKKFVEHPVLGRIYKTGDLVRLLDTGDIEYLGRNDFQVKIRGLRIELGEVEARLAEISGIKQVVVLAIKGRLVAYYVGNEMSEESLQQKLKNTLPDYMIPSAFVYMTSFPITINGKLDRRALPQPATKIEEFVAPSNSVETKLQAIVADILGLKPADVSVDASFFNLGGDSIKAIQLSNRIKQHMDKTISIKQIFDAKTVQNIVKLIDKAKEIEVLNEQGELTGDVKLLPVQEWFFEEYNTSYFNQAFAISLPENLDLARLKQALIDLVNYHDALRISFEGKKQYYTARITDVELLSANTSKEFNEIQQSFALNGKLYRFVLNRSKNVLVVVCHHLVIDSVSWQIIAEDLKRLYNGQKLPAKGTSYRQWSLAVQELKNSSVVKLNEANKQSQLLSQTATYSTVNISLSHEVTQKLLSTVNKVYNTQINDVLLTALARVLKTIHGDDSSYIKLESHGRAEIAKNLNIQRTVGWFTAIYPQTISTNLMKTKHYTKQVKNYGVDYDVKFGIHSQNLPKIMFNYLGQLDKGVKADWSIVESNVGQSTNVELTDLLTINGGVLQGKLSFEVSGHLKSIDKIAQQYQIELVNLVAELSQYSRTYLTIDDVDSNLSQAQLDLLQKDDELEDIVSANSLQEGFIYQSLNNDTNDDAYICSFIFDYDQTINVKNYREAWKLVQQEYPSLRLKLNAEYGEMLQIIPKHGNLDFALLTDVSVDEVVREQRAIPFNLSEGSLFRVRLIKVDDENFTCVLTYHHAISDGWSNPILLNAVHGIYARLNANKDIRLRTDDAYLASQHYLDRTKNDANDFWKNSLEEVSHPDLAGIFKPERHNTKLEEIKRIEKPIDKVYAIKGDEYKQLVDFTKVNGVTMNIIAQFAWHKLLSVYGGVKETTIGVVNAGRNIPVADVEDSVGLYIRTLPVQFAHTNASILDQLKNLQDINNNCMMHSNVSLANLQTEGTRLFDTVFIYENYPVMSDQGDDKLRVLNFRGKEKLDYPLTVVLNESKEGLNFQIKYAGEVFAEQTIDKLFKFMKNIISQITQNSSKLIYVDHVPEFGINHYPNTTIVNEFEKAALQHPNDIALFYEDLSYTFSELNAKANQVAHTLVEQFDVKPGDRVPLLLPKSDKTIIAILAILKAGAAYVPMAVTYPIDRINYIKKQVGAKFVVSERFMSQDFSTSKLNLHTAIQPESLAYIIFTSGTTGRPKGVMVEHRNFIIYLENILAAIKRTGTEDIEFGCMAEYVFDIFGTEVFGQLLRGKPINLFAGTPEEFPKFMQEHYVTTLQSTPGRISYFFQDNDKKILSTALTTIMVGGEKMNAAFANRFQNINLINIYGPTEGTVWTTMKKIATNYSNIGQPFPHYAHYVLDENKRLLPNGAVGELYISGPQLTRGYFGQPELTKKAYMENPYNINGIQEYSRMYKTGDIVRVLENNDFELIGRNDFQVKIRGFRIELGEIESAMLKVPGIEQVLALALGKEGNKYLGVYYVSPTEISRQKIEAVISQYLTDYMMPAGYQHMASFPLTINGKIDRRALPLITYKNDVEFRAPRNDIEQQVRQIICDLLELDSEQISVLENFFKIGGDSIKAIKLMAALRTTFNKKITIREIFNAKTIAAITQVIESNQSREMTHKLVVTKQQFNSKKDQKLSLAQMDSKQATTNMYSNVKMAFRLKENVDEDRLEQAVIQVVDRQEVLRTKIFNDYQVVDDDHLVVTHDDINRTSYFAHAFELENEIPIKVNIFNHEFTCLIDHIAFDGWSTSLFLENIERYYYDQDLPELPYQYKDFAKCQNDFLLSHDKDSQIDYWRKEFNNFQDLHLPVERQNNDQSRAGNDVYLELDTDFYTKLTQTVKANNMTMHNVLLSAYYLLLAKICGQQSISVAIPTVNRNVAGVENLIGLFINQFLITMKIDDRQSFAEFVMELNEKIIGAQNNQDIPLPRLLRELGIELTGNKAYFGIQGFKGEALEHSKLFMPIKEMNQQAIKDAFSDLTIFVWGQTIDFNYAKTLFKEESVKRFAESYRAILQKVVENIDTDIKSLI